MKYKFLLQGDWEKYKEKLLFIEYKCFKKSDRTINCVFKELIDDIKPFTQIVLDGKKPIAYFMCAPIEDCGTDLRRWDKNWGRHNTLYVFSIAVIPEYRNAGIGRELMNKLLCEAHKGFDRITLHTRNKDFFSMCIRCGFRKVKRVIMQGDRMDYLVKWIR